MTTLPKNWNRTRCPVNGHRSAPPEPGMTTDANPTTRPFTCPECGRSFRSLAAGPKANGFGVWVRVPWHFPPTP